MNIFHKVITKDIHSYPLFVTINNPRTFDISPSHKSVGNQSRGHCFIMNITSRFLIMMCNSDWNKKCLATYLYDAFWHDLIEKKTSRNDDGWLGGAVGAARGVSPLATPIVMTHTGCTEGGQLERFRRHCSLNNNKK